MASRIRHGNPPLIFDRIGKEQLGKVQRASSSGKQVRITIDGRADHHDGYVTIKVIGIKGPHARKALLTLRLNSSGGIIILTRLQKKRLALIDKALMAGFAILPLKPHGKSPTITGGVNEAATDVTLARSHFRGHPADNYGIATGAASGIFVLDVDGKAGVESRRRLEKEHGPLPATVTVHTGKGWHRYYRCPDAPVRNSAGKLGTGIDVRGDGGYVVGAGSIHPNGDTYRYVKGKALGEIEIAPAPAWLVDLVAGSAMPAVKDNIAEPMSATNRKRLGRYFEGALRRELDKLRRAPVSTRNSTLNQCAFRLGQFVPYGVGTASTITAGLTKAAAETGLDPWEIGPTINSGLSAGEKSPRHLRFLDAGTEPDSADKPTNSDDELAKRLANLGETDADNARRLAARSVGQLLHAPGAGWLAYDGKRWLPDSAKQRQRLALEAAERIQDELAFIPDMSRGAVRSKFVQQSKSKGGIDRMLAMAESMVAVDDKNLDGDPWLLNVANGTIDLKTGELLPHDPRDLITKIAPVRFDPDAKCPAWKKVVKRALRGDQATIEFFRRLAGYTLTGDSSEQVFAFVHGRQNTSKSTVINCFRDMLGDYGLHTATETLLIKTYDNAIPNDIARLRGARMVTAIEANFGRQLDEAKIKAMTGGDKLAARFMRGEWFEFQPEFKLFMVANDFLRVRQSSGAFWRRVRVISFDVEVPAEERDQHLSEKLRHEWPGILAWAVRGCRAWQRKGLGAPPAVQGATDKWREAADHVQLFINETCVMDGSSKTPASTVYAVYKSWCVNHGEHPLSTAKFKPAMIDLNLTHKRTKRGSFWLGLAIK